MKVTSILILLLAALLLAAPRLAFGEEEAAAAKSTDEVDGAAADDGVLLYEIDGECRKGDWRIPRRGRAWEHRLSRIGLGSPGCAKPSQMKRR